MRLSIAISLDSGGGVAKDTNPREIGTLGADQLSEFGSFNVVRQLVKLYDKGLSHSSSRD